MKKKLGFSLVGIGLLSSFLYFQNNALVSTSHTYHSEKIPKDFDGFKIIHLSDLHNKLFLKNQEKLVNKIKAEQADIVVITGDIIDANRYNATPSITLVKELTPFLPVFYVTGNHEASTKEFPILEAALIKAGAQVMRNTTLPFTIGDTEILITGIDDPAFNQATTYIDDETFTASQIEAALEHIEKTDQLHLLLTHRPELLETYAAYEFDLVFSGHAHGGQIRIPFLGGIIAPNQGFFPEYTAGLHTIDKTTISVSRGLGNSLFPFRIFNRPEIVVLTLRHPN